MEATVCPEALKVTYSGGLTTFQYILITFNNLYSDTVYMPSEFQIKERTKIYPNVQRIRTFFDLLIYDLSPKILRISWIYSTRKINQNGFLSLCFFFNSENYFANSTSQNIWIAIRIPESVPPNFSFLVVNSKYRQQKKITFVSKKVWKPLGSWQY